MQVVRRAELRPGYEWEVRLSPGQLPDRARSKKNPNLFSPSGANCYSGNPVYNY